MSDATRDALVQALIYAGRVHRVLPIDDAADRAANAALRKLHEKSKPRKLTKRRP